MWHEQIDGAETGSWKRLRTIAAAAFGLTLAGAAAAATQVRDPALTRTSEQGQFRVQISSDASPIPMRRIHSWTIRLADDGGHSVERATIKVDGGMPEHHHGLPTQPEVAATETPGVYKINGVRFSMTGWWVFNLDIATPDGRADTVTFNVTL
ncbi:FixH family protein [Brevundimonas sp.]|uniref:FixH family protein n=1 Tax=Brevundimonas sp. TaxID=1871086 RepID=UPI002D3623D9|nr:FixH family protein [Brevundimonas sp.]HYD26340.1 FixH family protein [Brevundimonas sp.]